MKTLLKVTSKLKVQGQRPELEENKVSHTDFVIISMRVKRKPLKMVTWSIYTYYFFSAEIFLREPNVWKSKRVSMVWVRENRTKSTGHLSTLFMTEYTSTSFALYVWYLWVDFFFFFHFQTSCLRGKFNWSRSEIVLETLHRGGNFAWMEVL